MTVSTGDPGVGAVYACGTAARWLPRALGGAVLAAGLLAAARIGATTVAPGARSFRGLLVLMAAIVALWVVRKGSEVRLRIRVGTEGLVFEHRRRSASLPYATIESVRYEAPFGASRTWVPAAVLGDREGRDWRLCGLLDGGERLLGDVVSRSGRDDLAAWVEAQGIVRKMARVSLRLRVGYVVAGGLVLVAVLHLMR